MEELQFGGTTGPVTFSLGTALKLAQLLRREGALPIMRRARVGEGRPKTPLLTIR